MEDSTHQTPETLRGSYVCVNGDLKPAEEPHVRAYDRGFMYADGVYDAIPVYESKAILLDRHLKRLHRSAKAAKIDLDHPTDRLREWIVETLEESGVENGGCRIIVSRGAGRQGLKYSGQEMEPTVVVIPAHADRDELDHGRPTEEKARIVSTRTVPPDTIDPKLKGLNYLNNVLAQRELAGTDATNGIMLDHQGRVAEGFDANVFTVGADGVFRTPPVTNTLEGITRTVVLERAADLEYDVEVRDITPAELFAAEDVFLTGSGCGITSIVELDGRVIGDGTPGADVVDLAEDFRSYVTANEYVDLHT